MVRVYSDDQYGRVVELTNLIEYNTAVALLGRRPDFYLPPGLKNSDIYPQPGYVGFRRRRVAPSFNQDNPHYSVGAAYAFKRWRYDDMKDDRRLAKRFGQTPWQTFNRIMGLRLTHHQEAS